MANGRKNLNQFNIDEEYDDFVNHFEMRQALILYILKIAKNL